MALINRFEVINYLDKIGDSGKWQPNFRLFHLNMQGMSSLIRMDNGEGKTSLASALYLLLTRHLGLAAEVKGKMSPSGHSAWSHIRVEVVINDESQPLFVGTGSGVTGESWVFGVCGHREEELKYYFYQGRLEDLPAAHDYGDRIRVLTNKEFYDNQKLLGRVKWVPFMEEYLAALASIFPPRAFQLGLDLHIRGGAENNDIFPVHGKNPASEIFYNHIAPHLLASDIPAEEAGEEGEYFFEDTIVKSAQCYGQATIQTERCRKKFEILDATVQNSRRLQAATNDAIKKEEAAQQARKGSEFGLIILDQIVAEQAIPGIPNDDVPEGLLGDLVKGIVWHAGEQELCIQDSALVLLTGQTVGHLNRDAVRFELNCYPKEKDKLVLSRSGSLKLELQVRGKVYPVESAHTLLERCGVGFPGNRNLDDVRNLVTEAIGWWRVNCDTNPARAEVRRTQEAISTAGDKIAGLSGEIEGLDRLETEATRKLEGVEQGKSAWEALSGSGLFSEDELREPIGLGNKVRREVEEARTAKTRHTVKKEKLTPLEPYFQKCQEEFPGIPPQQALQNQQQRRIDLQGDEGNARHLLGQVRNKRDHCKDDVSKIQKSLDKLVREGEKFDRLQPDNQAFLEIFGEENPRGLEKQVLKDLQEAGTNRATALTRKEQLAPLAEYIRQFNEQHPSGDCDVLIANTKSDLADLQRHIDGLEGQKSEIELKLKDLRQHRIAPSPIGRKVLDLVKPSQNVHQVIGAMNLPSQRMAQVLSSLSSVLFAPVFSTPEEAGKAVTLLEKEKLPIPVFLEEELRIYAENHPVRQEGGVFYSHQVGCQTLTVATIIDPEKIHHLISEAEQELAGLEKLISGAGNKKLPLEKRLEWLTEVKRALKEDAAEKLHREEKKLAELERNFPYLEKRASDKALDAIRGRCKYLDLGGDTRKVALGEELAGFQTKLEVARKAVAEAQGDFDTAEERETVARNNLRAFENNWFRIETMLNNAVVFVSEEGPHFMASLDWDERNLHDRVTKAEKRLPFNFEAAQQFIDCGGQLENLIADLERIRRSKTDLQNRKNDLETEKNRQTGLHKKALDRMRRLDEGTAKVLSVWKDFHGTIRSITKGATVHNLETIKRVITEKAPHLIPFFTAIERIGANVHQESGAENIRKAFVLLTDSLSEIGNKIDEVVRKQRFADNARNVFKEECERYLELAESLSPYEKEVIVLAESYEDVLKVFRDLETSWRMEKAKLDELEAGLDNITDKAHERLVCLLDAASDNMRLLKNVARRTANGTIFIEDTLIDDDGLKELIRNLLIEVEKELRRRQESKKSSFAKEDSRAEAAWNKTLRSKIAEWFYQGVFPAATVKVQHPSIRGGKPIPFPKKTDVSSGELLAVSLVIVGKLQEFIQEREAYWQTKDRGHRRKRGKTQGLLLLDGIFSRLSKKKMIQVAMEAYRGLKGQFQLIGLNHYEIENDVEVFPNYFEVKKVTTTTGGFLQIDKDYRPVRPEDKGRREGELIVARSTITPIPE
jgi:hypothetical protein